MVQAVFVAHITLQSGTPYAYMLPRQDHVLLQLVNLLLEVNLSIPKLVLQLGNRLFLGLQLELHSFLLVLRVALVSVDLLDLIV